MIDPALNEIMKKVDCRYTLVAAVAKRARQIVNDPAQAADTSFKPVVAAVDDMMNDRITYRYAEEPAKN
jgi:DNA-directed RNA polymerase subunit omega